MIPLSFDPTLVEVLTFGLFTSHFVQGTIEPCNSGYMHLRIILIERSYVSYLGPRQAP